MRLSRWDAERVDEVVQSLRDGLGGVNHDVAVITTVMQVLSNENEALRRKVAELELQLKGSSDDNDRAA